MASIDVAMQSTSEEILSKLTAKEWTEVVRGTATTTGVTVTGSGRLTFFITGTYVKPIIVIDGITVLDGTIQFRANDYGTQFMCFDFSNSLSVSIDSANGTLEYVIQS